METLPQLPEPHRFTCDGCREPMDLWDWGSHPVDTADLPPAHCSSCLVGAAAEIPKEQETLWPIRQWMFVNYEQQLHHRMRLSIGEPPGTTIAWEVRLPDQNDLSLSYLATIYAVCVNWWHQDWPQVVRPWRQSWESRLVVLGAHVLASSDISASWRLLWQWHHPGHQETLILDPPDASLTKDQVHRLNKARGAFYTFHDNRGRTPRFKHMFDFYHAADSAVAALKKRRRPITAATAGSYLIARSPLTLRPDSIGAPPSDPGRQFRKWCEDFKFDAEELLKELQDGL